MGHDSHKQKVPCDRQINHMHQSLPPIIPRGPVRSSVRSNAAMVPGALVIPNFLQYEVVNLYNVGVLLERQKRVGKSWVELDAACACVPSFQTGSRCHLCTLQDFDHPSCGHKASSSTLASVEHASDNNDIHNPSCRALGNDVSI